MTCPILGAPRSGSLSSWSEAVFPDLGGRLPAALSGSDTILKSFICFHHGKFLRACSATESTTISAAATIFSTTSTSVSLPAAAVAAAISSTAAVCLSAAAIYSTAAATALKPAAVSTTSSTGWSADSSNTV